ncbi:CUB and sushi domain-containing protein 2-like [Diachasma alloeum]|uniref:CUB and sushi domain-containing protein 2-like n=1 Tax=Diachasma alloeum TaxID=454923 RepID=UPI00073839A7|nr:CUB and sushi domain-containing protein 2-like [Diachasma alloeum]
MKWQIFYCALFLIAKAESSWLLDRICDYDLTDPHGLITSPNYPHSYPSSVVCTYKIIQPRERIVSLSLSHIDLGWNDTDSCSGRLEIYDGDDDLARRLEVFCGTDYFIPSRVINSTTNALFLKLESHSSSRGNIGFQAVYKTTDLECGGLFKENNGTIQHPTHGTQYKNNENCDWVIQAPPGHTIRLKFIVFQTQQNNDWVKISEFHEGKVVDVTTVSGGTIPSAPVITRGRILYLHFRSDHNSVYSGFRANYTFVDSSGLNSQV